jgi:synaptobrevin family protein YKT6
MSDSEIKLISLSCWRKFEDGSVGQPTKDPVCLAMVNRIDLLGLMASMWYSSTILESIKFACRTVVSRTDRGHRSTITMKDLPFDIHCHVRADGLACCVIASQDYPQRVAFGLAFNTMNFFDAKIGEKWKTVERDLFLEPEMMKTDLNVFQDPKNDKMCKIQSDLDAVKDVMRQNIQEILKRGETLDDVLSKSTDLSQSSKQFYESSEDLNSCWRRWGCSIM